MDNRQQYQHDPNRGNINIQGDQNRAAINVSSDPRPRALPTRNHSTVNVYIPAEGDQYALGKQIKRILKDGNDCCAVSMGTANTLAYSIARRVYRGLDPCLYIFQESYISSRNKYGNKVLEAHYLIAANSQSQASSRYGGSG